MGSYSFFSYFLYAIMILRKCFLLVFVFAFFSFLNTSNASNIPQKCQKYRNHTSEIYCTCIHGGWNQGYCKCIHNLHDTWKCKYECICTENEGCLPSTCQYTSAPYILAIVLCTLACACLVSCVVRLYQRALRTPDRYYELQERERSRDKRLSKRSGSRIAIKRGP